MRQRVSEQSLFGEIGFQDYPGTRWCIIGYKEIAGGQSKSEAMRRAQLAVMHDPRFAHPYYWAPIIVLGDWK